AGLAGLGLAGAADLVVVALDSAGSKVVIATSVPATTPSLVTGGKVSIYTLNLPESGRYYCGTGIV
ncbi:MAG: hypothetical protein R6X18_07365, partial [Chloroflexota bacterium]